MTLRLVRREEVCEFGTRVREKDNKKCDILHFGKETHHLMTALNYMDKHRFFVFGGAQKEICTVSAFYYYKFYS